MRSLTYAAVAILGSALVVVVVVGSSSEYPICPTFNEVKDVMKTDETLITCHLECLKRTTTDAPVNGTLHYHKNSDVCLSGLHAGVLNMSRGSLRIREESFPLREIHGTCRNRICSSSITSPGSVFTVAETESVFIEKAGRDDVMLIHDSYNGGTLKVLCLNGYRLSQTSPLKKWNYKNMEKIMANEDDPSKALLILNAPKSRANNLHAFQCLGRFSHMDVFAPLIFRYAQYKTAQYTWRANKGDDLDIEITEHNRMSLNTTITRFPAPNPQRTRYGQSLLEKNPDNGQFRMKLSNVTPEDNGLYLLGDNRNGAYFNIIVRDCESEKFGSECQQRCPECQNGGQCHSYTGECLCPPGFIGDNCEHACPEGWFGTRCQFRCGERTLSFRPPDGDEGSCKGITICLPGPIGCSCPAGYKGPVCDDKCGDGEYGSGCTGSCTTTRCPSRICDSVTGSCLTPNGYHPSTGSPTNVRVRATRSKELTVTWKDKGQTPSRRYFVTHKLKRIRSCPDMEIKNALVEQMVVKGDLELEVVLKDLQVNSIYEICITTSDESEGLSRPSCAEGEETITDGESPAVKITLRCSIVNSGTGIDCKATLEGGCRELNGQTASVVFILSSYLACNETEIKETKVMTLDPNSWHNSQLEVSHTFSDLIRGLTYNVSAKVSNDVGDGETSWADPLDLPNGYPPPVENPTVAILGEDRVRLMWKDPCPSFGDILQYYIPLVSSDYITKGDTKCPSSYSENDGCITIRGLEKGETYNNWNCKIIAYNSYGGSEDTKFNFVMKEREPSEPKIGRIGRHPRLEQEAYKLIIHPPTQPGGQLTNCTVRGLGKPCVVRYEEEDGENEAHICQFDQLKAGTLFTIEAFCCNVRFCGEKQHKEVATKPATELQGSLRTGAMTNTTMNIFLPEIINEGDGNSSFTVIVGRVSEGKDRVEDLRKSGTQLLNARKRRNKERNSQNRREVDDADRCDGEFWIAGLVPANTKEFVVGDGETYEGFYNCPLDLGKSYEVGVLAVTKLLDQRKLTWLQLGAPVILVPGGANSALGLWIVALFVIILVIAAAVIAVVIFIRKHPGKVQAIWPSRANGQERDKLKADSFSTFPGPPAEGGDLPPQGPLPPAISMTSIATNDKEHHPNQIDLYMEPDDPIYGNLERCVPRHELESYLNKTINSAEAIEEFKSVGSYLKSIEVGKNIIYKGKNRYRNNLPYDETRVKLSVINNDPSTDYINANYIQGYSNNMRYIATQGPKEGEQSTIYDFWRMIVEQQVTDIIMVANFVEGGKSKVGQYLNTGETLRFQEFTIKVTSSNHLPYFTVSTVEVFINAIFKQKVLHYHYTNWPDHGVPEEPRSMAALITYFLMTTANEKRTTVVHCSAGIGRTGTVLMVLLLNEMLTLNGSLDPLEALVRLREGRGRLVENEIQYNLALEIAEEVFFGNQTTVPSSALLGELETLVQKSPSQYRQANTLASPLSYRLASCSSFSCFNRNPGVLPADSQRIFLNMRNGNAESQYINAVRIRSLTKKEAMVVTEHPVKEAVGRFWRLITERNCSLLILINEYSPNMMDEFVPLLPEDAQEFNIEGYKIMVTSRDCIGHHLFQYSLSIADSYGSSSTVTVYQVLNWKYGSSIPDNPDILVTLAELILQNVSTSEEGKGSPLLCCGDGVTGCGLVAGVTLMLELAQTEQVFNVYRTVVRLRRSRQQFITSEEQFSMMYVAASKYIENFSTYANFS